jgi:UDP-N-acetylglucosamine 2-epimerase (non-hydrolysing)
MLGKMKKIMVVFGTRPEAIKMCPLVKELYKTTEFQTIVVITGQHREMLKQVLDSFLVTPDYDLNIMKEGQTLFDITSSILTGMKKVLETEKPDLVLVHGDTTTAFAASLAAFYLNIPYGHVEAGLRTYDLSAPYPEEYNRQAIGIGAKFHFAPTETAKRNLLKEGKEESSIFVTGNTIMDALNLSINENYSHPVLEWAAGSRLVLLTAHRRENLGAPLYDIFHGIKQVLNEFNDLKVLYPIHLNPAIRKIAAEVFKEDSQIKIIEPLNVIDFHNIMYRTEFILTDSGGIQEEASGLKKPVLVLRDTTERPEGIQTGTLKLIGTGEENIYREFKRLLTDKEEYEAMSKASNPYGDGTACKQIIGILTSSL